MLFVGLQIKIHPTSMEQNQIKWNFIQFILCWLCICILLSWQIASLRQRCLKDVCFLIKMCVECDESPRGVQVTNYIINSGTHKLCMCLNPPWWCLCHHYTYISQISRPCLWFSFNTISLFFSFYSLYSVVLLLALSTWTCMCFI